jgi:hypothetical protein
MRPDYLPSLCLQQSRAPTPTRSAFSRRNFSRIYRPNDLECLFPVSRSLSFIPLVEGCGGSRRASALGSIVSVLSVLSYFDVQDSLMYFSFEKIRLVPSCHFLLCCAG